MPTDVAHFHEGLLVADRFRLVRELGRGGMGAVWLAHHLALDMQCALKLVDPQSKDSDEVRARFEIEARSAAQIKSRHVVQVLDHGVWEGIPFIAMEYLEGQDLGARLDQQGTLSPAATFRVVSHVARALTRAHALGVIHRDLKPENVFLARDDDGEIAKVVDFGIAKRARLDLGDSTTRPGVLIGTPFYMSPEQARGALGIDHRSDLWSLAVIAFECLTGHTPFPGEGLGVVIGKIMYEPLPVPSALGPVPPGFDAWWRRASARDPDQRFQSATELVDALAVALEISIDVDARLDFARAVVPGGPPSADVSAKMNAVTLLDATTADPLSSTVRLGDEPAPVPRKRWVWVGAGASVAAILVWALAGRSAPAPVAAAQPSAAPAASVVAAPEPAPAPTPTPTPTAPVPPAASEMAPATKKTRAPARPTAPARKPPGQVDFGI